MSFYAVRIGRKPGVYTTWADCNAQVKGHPKATFKKFGTSKEAEDFVAGSPQSQIVATTYEIWTDGSSDLGLSAGYAWAIIKGGAILKEGGSKIAGPASATNPLTAQQAEVYAVIEGVRAFHDFTTGLGVYHSFTVYSDSMFVISTLNDLGPSRGEADWKNKAYATEFINLLAFIKTYRTWAPINFVHVNSHSNLKFNDHVDAKAEQYRLSS